MDVAVSPATNGTPQASGSDAIGSGLVRTSREASRESPAKARIAARFARSECSVERGHPGEEELALVDDLDVVAHIEPGNVVAAATGNA